VRQAGTRWMHAATEHEPRELKIRITFGSRTWKACNSRNTAIFAIFKVDTKTDKL
jgi:hypothetical protein